MLERRTSKRLCIELRWPIWCFIRFPLPTAISIESTLTKAGYMDAITSLGDHHFLTCECITEHSILRAFAANDFNKPVAEVLIHGRMAFLATEGFIIYAVDLLNLRLARFSIAENGKALASIPLPFQEGEDIINGLTISSGFIFLLTLGDSIVFSCDIRSTQYRWNRHFAVDSDEVDSFDVLADLSDERNHKFVFIVDGNEVQYRENDNVFVTIVEGAEHCRFIANTDAVACVAIRHKDGYGGGLPLREFHISVIVVDLLRQVPLFTTSFIGSGLLKFFSITNGWNVVTVCGEAVANDHFLTCTTMTLKDLPM